MKFLGWFGAALLLVGGFSWIYFNQKYSATEVGLNSASGLLGSPSYDFMGQTKELLLQSLASQQNKEMSLFSFAGEIKNANNEVVKTCRVFKSVDAEFIAEGMAISGDPVQMTLVGPCKLDELDGAVQIFKISKKELFNKRVVANADVQFKSTKAKFSHPLTDIPSKWFLKEIHFNSYNGKVLTIERKDLQKIDKDPFYITL